MIPVFDLFERPIPPLFFCEKQFKHVVADSVGQGGEPLQVIRIPANTVYWIELDAGELTTGYFRLMCLAGKGAQVTILYSEGYQEIVSKPGEPVMTKKGCRDQAENSVLEGHEDYFFLSGKPEQYISFLFRTFRFVRLEVATKEFETVIKLPDYLETGYPLEDKTKFLSASEEWIEPLWEVSKRTLHRCMHETYEDCPYYEQMQYTMDTRLQCLFTYALSGDTRLATRAIYDYHCSQLPDGMLQSRYPCCEPQVIPPFALHWIFMLWDYYWETGEAEVLDRYLGTVIHVLGYFRRHKKEGLVEHLGYWEMADWVPEWNDHYGVPHACDDGPSTIFNFMYSSALQTAAKIMETLSLQDFAGKLLQEAEQINQTIHHRCFDTQRNLYRDGPQTEEYSQLAQVWAALAGTQDPCFRQALMVQVLQEKELILCTFPCQFYLLRAYEKTGLYGQTAEVWGTLKQQLDLHLTTLPETPADSRSDCHAWSALLLYEFPRKVLGVSALSPGYQRILGDPKAW